MPIGLSARPGELAFQGELLVWINEIIKSENLPFDGASQEYIMEGSERPDILIWRSRRAREAALLLSLKVPHYDAWDAADDALVKASRWPGGIRYFATWNINRFFLWDRYRAGDLYDMLCYQREVAKISRVEEAERIEDQLRLFFTEFLKEFAEVYFERKALPPLPIDERFIFRLRSAVDAFSIPAFFLIRERVGSDRDFRDRLKRWFAEQGWTFLGTDDDFEKVARQYIYLLINKILFYNILRLKNRDLPKITVPLGVDGAVFKNVIQSYFDKALKIDYETIFAADFLDTIPIPDEITGQLRSFIDKISEHDYKKFSDVGYEILGRVFERLIPDRERHTLGQYYTRSDVVDLIVGFCVRNADDKVLDGACGAGTFLVRSYAKKKTLNPSKTHEELLDELYGIDIAKFPSHLTTINLARIDLGSIRNYPKVISKDFFDVACKEVIPILGEEYAKLHDVRGLDSRSLTVTIPECDAVVMNPPYTRQEEMEGGVFSEGYRTTLQRLVKEEWDGFQIGKRSSIYSYFFIHGAKFLKERGRLGLVTSNSWLDVDYGKYLQEFFLKNFKIVAIIESKVERWFEDADINTAITILERCSDEEERMSHSVKFVQLKKTLAYYIPPTDNERERWSYVESFVSRIDKISKYYEDDGLRVFVKKQKELWDEGYNEEDKVYEGAKWGKYLRAPDIFFKILEKGGDKLTRLDKISVVRYPIKTGINEFFYVTRKIIEKFGIEDEFLIPVVKTPKEFKAILLNTKDLETFLFSCTMSKKVLAQSNKKGALRYIEWGEKQVTKSRQKTQAGIPWPKVPSVQGRKYWYGIPEIATADAFSNRFFDTRFFFGFSTSRVIEDQTFYGITYHPELKRLKLIQNAILNSTLTSLFVEVHGRTTLGQGVLQYAKYEMERLTVLNATKVPETLKEKLENIFVKLCKRKILPIFEEIGATSPEEVSLDKVKPDRRELDEIVMGEILGLTEEEQLEVYQAVIDLVKSRIEKAKSVPKKTKKVKGLDVEALVNDVISEVGRLKRFPEDFISLEGVNCREISIPKGRAEIGRDLHGFYVEIDGEKIRCNSPYEARYIQYSSLNGKTVVRIPKDEPLILKAVTEYKPILEEAMKRISEYLESTIPDNKLRDKVKDEVWLRITGQK